MPVIDHWWQTETGWPVCANCIGLEKLPVKPGFADQADAGIRRRVLDERGERCRSREIGDIVIKLPLPPGRCRRSGTTTRAS